MSLNVYTSEFLGTLDKNTLYNFEITKKHEIIVYNTDIKDDNNIRGYQAVIRFGYSKIKKSETYELLGKDKAIPELKSKTYVIYDMTVNNESKKTQEAIDAILKILSAQLKLDENEYNVIIACHENNKDTIEKLLDNTKAYKHINIESKKYSKLVLIQA